MNIKQTSQKGAAMVWALLLILAAAGAYVYFSQEGSVDEIINEDEGYLEETDEPENQGDMEVQDPTEDVDETPEVVSYDVEVVGTLQYDDLEGGCWVFATDNGDSYQLLSLDEDLFVDGARIAIKGNYADGMVGICQNGDFVEVQEYEVLEMDMMTVQVPVWSDTQTPNSVSFAGCGGYIAFEEHEAPQSQAVLNATYQKLFDLPAGENNAVGTQNQLSFDNVTLSSGIASVYLSGEIWANHCADAVFKAQIEQAAFQFDSVVLAQVYLNNELFDWCDLDQSNGEGQCPEQPKLWVTLNQ
jgi:hypothetical protein